MIFNSGSPGNTKNYDVVGLTAGDTISGLDIRPATGELYAGGYSPTMGMVGSSRQLYKITIDFKAKVATATLVGPRDPTMGAFFGFGVNPVTDRIRVINNADENKSVDPTTGVATTQTPLAFQANDPNNGDNPSAVDATYTNQQKTGDMAPTSTELYDIDANNDALVLQMPPASGQLFTVGPLGVNVSNVGGYDIMVSQKGFAALQPQGRNRSRLYSINEDTGKASDKGSIGGLTPLESLAELPGNFPDTPSEMMGG